MASPQVENGHTDIANELLDAMICYDFTKRQYKVLLAVIRKTYGWRKKDDDIPSSQLSEMTGLADTHCRAAVRELVDLRVIDAKPGRYGQVISIEKDYSRWISKKDQNSPGRTKTVRTETVRGEDQNGPATRTKTVREGGPKRSSQKKLSKTTIKSPQGYTERDRDPRANAPRRRLLSLWCPRGGCWRLPKKHGRIFTTRTESSRSSKFTTTAASTCRRSGPPSGDCGF